VGDFRADAVAGDEGDAVCLQRKAAPSR
jgi:hypothetical protein